MLTTDSNPDSQKKQQPKRTPEQLLKDLWYEMRELGADEYMRNEAMSTDHGSSYWALEPVDWAHSRVCDILWEIAEFAGDTQYMGIPDDDGPSSRYCYAEDEGGAE